MHTYRYLKNWINIYADGNNSRSPADQYCTTVHFLSAGYSDTID